MRTDCADPTFADREFLGCVLSSATIIAVAACLVVFALRVGSAISISEPLQLTTSGSEEESLFGVWKIAHRETLYVDRREVPYAAIVYNWFFYHSYGNVVRSVSAVLDLGDEWLPTLARLFTLIGATVLTVAAFKCLYFLFGNTSWASRLLSAGYAIYLGFGPLTGFWSLTTRPDIWALTWEVIGTYVFLRLYRRRTVVAVAAAAVAAYLAWSFKQTNVAFLCATGGTLLLRRNWRALAIFVGLIGIFFVATFLIGGEQYARSIFFVGWRPEYQIDHFFAIASNFAVKAIPTLVSFAAALGWMILSSNVGLAFRDDSVLFGLCGVLSAVMVNVILSSHLGAGENYYFSLNWFLVVTSVPVLSRFLGDRKSSSRAATLLLSAGWLVVPLALAPVFAGWKGTVSLQPLHSYYSRAKACLDDLPRPLYVNRPYLSLPWMTPGSIPFVVSWFYYFDRKNGVPFENGGLAGIVADRRLAAVVVTRVTRTDSIDGLDGRDLPGYRRASIPDCPEFVVLLRDDHRLEAR